MIVGTDLPPGTALAAERDVRRLKLEPASRDQAEARKLTPARGFVLVKLPREQDLRA